MAMNMQKKSFASPDETRAFDKGLLELVTQVMDDGSEAEFGPGEVSLLPPGHDAWVVGDEPVVVIDIGGMRDYAGQA
jgi:hypothetical protein